MHHTPTHPSPPPSTSPIPFLNWITSDPQVGVHDHKRLEATRTLSGKWLRNRARSMMGGGSEDSADQHSHQASGQFHQRSTESCPNASVDSGSPTPDGVMTRTRFSWRKKPLDLLKMVEGHFTVEESNPWEEFQGMDTPSPFPETPELPLPDLMGTSDIMTDDHRRSLCKHLPARAEGYAWSPLYSTSSKGFSLKTMYREVQKVDSPVLVVIEDTTGSVFGSLVSCPLKTSDLFYGTGETFLFTFDPEFRAFTWTGDNMYFVKGNMDSIVIGAGDGNFGLWLDGDLCHGRSQPCATFGNPQLSKQEDFMVKTLECWGFV